MWASPDKSGGGWEVEEEGGCDGVDGVVRCVDVAVDFGFEEWRNLESWCSCGRFCYYAHVVERKVWKKTEKI